jgi:hypothetical protein
MGERKPRILHHERKKIELPRRKVNFLVVAPKEPAVEIDFQIADFQDLGLGFGLNLRAPKNRAKPCRQFSELERLSDVVVRAGFQAADFVFIEIPHGDHEYAGVRRGLSDSPTGFDASDAGHIDVQQNEIERLRLDNCESFFSVARFLNGKTARGQGSSQGFAEGGFVVNNEDTIWLRQRYSPLPSRSGSSSKT